MLQILYSKDVFPGLGRSLHLEQDRYMGPSFNSLWNKQKVETVPLGFQNLMNILELQSP